LKPQTLAYLRFYNFFQEGFLPAAGGLLDQPAKFLAAMEVLNTEHSRLLKEEEEKLWKSMRSESKLPRTLPGVSGLSKLG